MKLNDIFQKLSRFSIVETRVMDEEYIELVFPNRDLAAWYQTLATDLGEPRKPAGREPTDTDLTLTRATGGIRINQTLFEKSFGDVTVIAKFWPWGDEEHTTLKMALLIH